MQSMAVAPDGATAPVQLKAVDDLWPLYGSLTLAGGRTARAPAADEAWIAPALAERLALRPGATIRQIWLQNFLK